MLEIVILWALGKKVAAMCKERGRTAWPWVVMLVLSWYGGAFAGAVVAVVVNMAVNPNLREPDMMFLLIGCLLGALGGVCFTLTVVSLLPAAERYDDYDDYDDRDDGYPRRRRGRTDEFDDGRYEDDYDRPRKKRRHEDEYDDYEDRDRYR